ncbi:MAG: hypothetical protein ACT4OJ_03655 [Bacteroidota bacterium]
MKKKTHFIITAFALALGAGIIVLTSSASDKKKTQSPSCCQKTEKQCSEENKKSGSGELIMENMSRQFISISPF